VIRFGSAGRQTQYMQAIEEMLMILNDLPPAIETFLHERALEVAYNGREELFRSDENFVGGEEPVDNFVACRYYLYYQVYTNELQRLVTEALNSGSDNKDVP
jgi:hypothetical protein